MVEKLTLTFNGVTLSPISHQNQIWLTAVELANALGYSRSDEVSRIYRRNADEFNDSMTTVLRERQNGVLGESSGLQTDKRLFSLRGCHLIAMFAKTEIAKQFRVWVLDVLDKEVGASKRNVMEEILADLNWQLGIQEKREAHSPMMHALKFARDAVGKKTTANHFTNENLFCNRALTGKWEALDEKDLDVYDLRLLKEIRNRNMVLMQYHLKQPDRKDALDQFVTAYRAKRPRLKLVINK